MTLVEIIDVSLAEVDPKQLWGFHIDFPQARKLTGGYGFDVEGWVLGRSSAVGAIEVVHKDSVVQRVPINIRRPHVAAAYPEVLGAEDSGFRTTVSVPRMSELELIVRAVLKDQSRVHLGVVRARRRWREEDHRVGAALVSVVIPCYNQAHFLGEAIESVLAQTYPHFEIVVVDDGSTDSTSKVASRYPGVRCIRQENQGLAAARNTGIRRSNGSYLVFLDADDRLLPEALEVGLEHLDAHPECAFVSGQHVRIAPDGSLLEKRQQPLIEKDHYVAALRGNYIGMHATVMYRRSVFETVGNFDTSLNACEDYELCFRVAREFPVYCHAKVVAEYRRHDTNMSHNPALMLGTSVAVLRSQWKYTKSNEHYRSAYKAGMRFWQGYYGDPLVEEVRAYMRKHEWKQTLRDMRVLLRYYPRGLASVLITYPSPWATFGLIQHRTRRATEEKGTARREISTPRRLLRSILRG